MERFRLPVMLAQRTACLLQGHGGCASGPGRRKSVRDVSALPLELRCHSGERTCPIVM
jgi:hypothetical protein